MGILVVHSQDEHMAFFHYRKSRYLRKFYQVFILRNYSPDLVVSQRKRNYAVFMLVFSECLLDIYYFEDLSTSRFPNT